MKQIIFKYTDYESEDWPVTYSALDNMIEFETCAPGLSFFVTFFSCKDGVHRVIAEIPVEMNLKDIHDSLLFMSDETEKYVDYLMYNFKIFIETEIEEYLFNDERVLDLNEVADSVSAQLTKLGQQYVEEIRQSWGTEKITEENSKP